MRRDSFSIRREKTGRRKLMGGKLSRINSLEEKKLTRKRLNTEKNPVERQKSRKIKGKGDGRRFKNKHKDVVNGTKRPQ